MTLSDLARYYVLRMKQTEYLDCAMEWYDCGNTSSAFEFIFRWAEAMHEADELGSKIGLARYDPWITGTAGALLEQARGRP